MKKRKRVKNDEEGAKKNNKKKEKTRRRRMLRWRRKWNVDEEGGTMNKLSFKVNESKLEEV